MVLKDRTYPEPAGLYKTASRRRFGTVASSKSTCFATISCSALDKPVVDGTGLAGRYEINVTSDADNIRDSLQQLLAPLGLVITTAQRDIELVVVRSQE